MDTLKTLRRLRRYGINPVLIIAFAAMIILSLSRLILSLWQWESIPDAVLLRSCYKVFELTLPQYAVYLVYLCWY